MDQIFVQSPFFYKVQSHGVEGGLGLEVPHPFLAKICKIKNVKSPFIVLVWFHILLHVSSSPLFSGQNLNVPSCLCKYLCFQRKLFVSFPTFCREKMLKWSSNLLQERYSKQRDKMLEAYFTCSIFIFVSLYILQMIAIPEWVWQQEWTCLFTQPNLEYTTSKKFRQHHPISTELSLYILQMITFPEWV